MAWRAELQTNYKASLALDLELQRAGTNALPFLVAAVRAKPALHQRLYLQAWRSGLHRAPTALRRHWYPPRLLMFANETLRQVAFTHLVALGPDAAPALPALIDVLRNSDELVASRVVEVLGNLGPAAKQGVPAMIDTHARFSSDFTLNTVRSLAKIDPKRPEVADVLIRSLQYDTRVVLAAAQVLQANRLETNRVVFALTGLLTVEPVSASQAATLLAEYGPEAAPAVPALIRMLQRPNERLRTQAAITLGKLGKAAAAAEGALRDALKDDHLQVREAAAAALKNVSGQQG
jgi:HEAT repeat protein